MNKCAYYYSQDLITSNPNDLKTKLTIFVKTVQEMASKIIYLENQLMVKPVFESILSENDLETKDNDEASEKSSNENTHESKENNESNTLSKESKVTYTIDMNDEIMIKETMNQGILFYCDMCS